MEFIKQRKNDLMEWQRVIDEVSKDIRQDNMQVKISNRITDIDNGKASLTPYEEGMNELIERIKAKFYNAEIK